MRPCALSAFEPEPRLARPAHLLFVRGLVDPPGEQVPAVEAARGDVVGIAVEPVDVLADAAGHVDPDGRVEVALGALGQRVGGVDVGLGLAHQRVGGTRQPDRFGDRARHLRRKARRNLVILDVEPGQPAQRDLGVVQ